MAQQVFVCNEIEMKDGDVRIIRQDRIEVGVYRHDGSFYAYRNHCLHQGGPACEGIIRGKVVDLYAPDKTFVASDLRRRRAAHRLPLAWLGIQAEDRRMRARSEAAAERHEVVQREGGDLCRHLTFSIAPAEALARAPKCSRAAVGDPDRIPDAELRALIANVVRLYAAKAENGMRTPLPPAPAASPSPKRWSPSPIFCMR